MRIVVVLPFEETFSSYSGGAIARWVYETYSLIKNSNILIVGRIDLRSPFDLLSTNKHFLVSKILFKIPYVRRFVYKLYLLEAYSDLVKADVIHVHNAPLYVCFIRALGFKAEIILHMHNNYFQSYTMSFIEKLETTEFKIIVCSKFLGDVISTKSKILGDRVSVIPNGVNPANFPVKAGNIIHVQPLKFLYLGRVVKGKGLLKLLESLKILAQKNIIFQLDIVGSNSFGGKSRGFYHNTCNDAIKEIQSISPECTFNWLGFVSHDMGLGTIICQSDVFICPSICEEAFGMAIVEAMSCGLPVVAFCSGGIPEIIDGFGVLVPKGDVDSLASALIKLNNNRCLLSFYSESSISRVKKYSWVSISKHLDQYMGKL